MAGCQIIKHLTQGPTQSQVKITALYQQREHLTPTTAYENHRTQFWLCLLKIYLKNYKTHREPQRPESEETYLAEEIDRVIPQTSGRTDQPNPVWSNVNQLLTINVLLHLMIV